MGINPYRPTLSQLIREHDYAYTIEGLEFLPHYRAVSSEEDCIALQENRELGPEESFIPLVWLGGFSEFIQCLLRPQSNLRASIPQTELYGKLLVVDTDEYGDMLWESFCRVVVDLHDDNHFISVSDFLLAKYTNCICLEGGFEAGDPSYQVYIPILLWN